MLEYVGICWIARSQRVIHKTQFQFHGHRLSATIKHPSIMASLHQLGEAGPRCPRHSHHMPPFWHDLTWKILQVMGVSNDPEVYHVLSKFQNYNLGWPTSRKNNGLCDIIWGEWRIVIQSFFQIHPQVITLFFKHPKWTHSDPHNNYVDIFGENCTSISFGGL